MPGEVLAETATIRPTFHHVNLKTLDLDRLIDWYGLVLGTKVTFRYAMGAWLTNDEANHRIALLALPGYVEDAYKQTHTGMHHMAFEYDRLEDLMATYGRLKGHGILPFFCFDHGMTLSLYYADPDGNALELQIDVFGDWAKSTAWMRDAVAFQENPLGVFLDPELIVAGLEAGLAMEELHERAYRGDYLPDPLPDITVPPISSA
jgi:catechol 2,3-dioxygenase